MSSRQKKIIIVSIVLEVIAIIVALCLAFIFRGTVFDKKQQISTITSGSLRVDWLDENNNKYSSSPFDFADKVISGQQLNHTFKIQNKGTLGAYVRVKIEVLSSSDNTTYTDCGNILIPQVDETIWLKDSSGYYYYNTSSLLHAPNPVFGQVCVDEIINFTEKLIFGEIPDSLENQSLKISLICEAIQSKTEILAENGWVNVPDNWQNDIGSQLSVYVKPTSTSKTNFGEYVLYELDASSLADVSVSLNNLGLNPTLCRIQPIIEVSNSSYPVGNISIFGSTNFTKTTSGYFYYNSVLEDTATLTISLVLGDAEAYSVDGLTYTVKFFVEYLQYSADMSHEDQFFTEAPSNYIMNIFGGDA